MNKLIPSFMEGFRGSLTLALALVVSLVAGLMRVSGRLFTAFLHHQRLPVDARASDTHRVRRNPC